MKFCPLYIRGFEPVEKVRGEGDEGENAQQSEQQVHGPTGGKEYKARGC